MKENLATEVLDLLALLDPDLQPIGVSLCEHLQSGLGAQLYVKTIYVGADLAGEMVAAMYPQGDHIELAMALSEDNGHPLLEDATHLTWRTMPVLVSVRDQATADACSDLLTEACARVREGRHGVNRDPDFFIGRTRRLTKDPRKPGTGRSRQ
jgi:hypothetical protein